jgi:hypothetical protein
MKAQGGRKYCSDAWRGMVGQRRENEDARTLCGMLTEALDRKLITANPATRLGKLYQEAGFMSWRR